jgi:alanyl-tRNA synthetase
VAAGVRRIEAVTSKGAQQLINARLTLLSNLENALNNAKDPLQALEKLMQENSEFKAKLEAMESAQIASIRQSLKDKFVSNKGLQVLIASLELPSADAAKQLCFQLKNEHENAVVGLVYLADSKPGIALYIQEKVVADKSLNASNIVREVAKNIQGGGGGQPFFATAGGKDATGMSAAESALKAIF